MIAAWWEELEAERLIHDSRPEGSSLDELLDAFEQPRQDVYRQVPFHSGGPPVQHDSDALMAPHGIGAETTEALMGAALVPGWPFSGSGTVKRLTPRCAARSSSRQFQRSRRLLHDRCGPSHRMGDGAGGAFIHPKQAWGCFQATSLAGLM